jgi:hypothetical protein
MRVVQYLCLVSKSAVSTNPTRLFILVKITILLSFSPPGHDHCRRSQPLSRVTPSRTWPGCMLLPVSENDSSDITSTIATLLSVRLTCECPRDCLSNADLDSGWEKNPECCDCSHVAMLQGWSGASLTIPMTPVREISKTHRGRS